MFLASLFSILEKSPQGITSISSLSAGLFSTLTKLLASPLYAGSLSLIHPLLLASKDMLQEFIKHL